MSEHIIWNEIGTLHFNAGAYTQASKAYQRAIELGEDFNTAMQNLALTYVQEGELAKAVPIYKEALELISENKDKAALWYQLGEIYEQLEDHENALYATKIAAELERNQDESLEQDLPSQPSPVSVLDLAEEIIGDTEPLNPEELQNVDEEPTPPEDEELATVKTADSHPAEGRLYHLNIEQIFANPVQPRLRVNVQDLVESIREYGIIQPLIVTPCDEEPHRYILVSGERRLQAARQVGLNTVPAIVRKISEHQRLEIALVENVQRQNLSLLEQADAYAQLKNEFGLSSDQIAKRMGKSSVAISNLLRLLELPEKIKRALDSNRINEEHARALFLLKDQKMQTKILDRILIEDLSVRKTEGLVRKLLVQVLEDSNQPDPEVDEPVFVEEVIKSDLDTAALAEVAEDMEESVIETEVVALTPIPDDEDLEEDNDEQAVELDAVEEAVSLDDNQEQPKDSLPEDEAPEIAPEDLEEDLAEDTLPIPSLPQTANFESHEAVLTEEQMRSRLGAFKRVTEVNPKNDKAWSKLGKYYFHLDEKESAIEAYLEAIHLAPNIFDYHHELGQVYISLRQFDNAAIELEKVVALNDKNIIAHCILASTYRHLEMDEKAQEHIDLVAPVIEYEKIYNQACFEAICGNVVRSVELLRTALDQEQTSIEQIQSDADFDFIRDEPIFAELVSKTETVFGDLVHDQEVLSVVEQ